MTEDQPHFGRVAIIGLGLIGGSVAKSMKQRELVDDIVAFDENAVALAEGAEQGIIDDTAASPAQAAEGAELVVLAVPVRAMDEVFESLAPLLDCKDVVITDVGSVKCAVYEAARRVHGDYPKNFVPGHPIAGSERHGVGAANANLFAHHKVILTPKLSTYGEATRSVRELWQALDAEVVEMDPDHHDMILAQTSHLPHLLAFALVDTLSSQGNSLEIFRYAAGGFRDFSRIAASDPIMWRDIFSTNPGPVLEILDRFIDDLGHLREMIDQGRSEDLAKVFSRAKVARDHFSTLLETRTRKRLRPVAGNAPKKGSGYISDEPDK